MWGQNLFVVILTYHKPLSEVDRLITKHVEFLERYYANGVFICSGKRVPRTGGVILAQASSQAEIQGILRQDPFYAEQVATFEVLEFSPSKWVPELNSILNQ